MKKVLIAFASILAIWLVTVFVLPPSFVTYTTTIDGIDVKQTTALQGQIVTLSTDYTVASYPDSKREMRTHNTGVLFALYMPGDRWSRSAPASPKAIETAVAECKRMEGRQGVRSSPTNAELPPTTASADQRGSPAGGRAGDYGIKDGAALSSKPTLVGFGKPGERPDAVLRRYFSGMKIAITTEGETGTYFDVTVTDPNGAHRKFMVEMRPAPGQETLPRAKWVYSPYVFRMPSSIGTKVTHYKPTLPQFEEVVRFVGTGATVTDKNRNEPRFEYLARFLGDGSLSVSTKELFMQTDFNDQKKQSVTKFVDPDDGQEHDVVLPNPSADMSDYIFLSKDHRRLGGVGWPGDARTPIAYVWELNGNTYMPRALPRTAAP